MSLPTWHFTDRTVIVTGAARGLGAAMSLAFVRAGARVAALDRDADALEQAVLGAGEHAPAMTIAVDVTDHDGLDRALDRVSAELGPIDVMVANAGIGLRGLSVDVSVADFEKVVDINLNGAYWMAQACGRVMQPGSTIVNIASVLGLTTAALPQAAYSASKAGLIGLTRDLAQQWSGRKGIRVNALAPGFFASEMTDELRPGYLESLMPRVIMGRLGDSTELAATAVWLASPAAGYVTGQTIVVDGGLTIA